MTSSSNKALLKGAAVALFCAMIAMVTTTGCSEKGEPAARFPAQSIEVQRPTAQGGVDSGETYPIPAGVVIPAGAVVTQIVPESPAAIPASPVGEDSGSSQPDVTPRRDLAMRKVVAGSPSAPRSARTRGARSGSAREEPPAGLLPRAAVTGAEPSASATVPTVTRVPGLRSRVPLIDDQPRVRILE